LNADGEAFFVKAAGHGKPRKARKIDPCRINIAEIHFKRIFQLFSDFESCGGIYRSSNNITFFKGMIKLVGDHPPYFQGFAVKLIVIARAKCIGTQKNTAFHLPPKPLSS
jgi:hypothetical protein